MSAAFEDAGRLRRGHNQYLHPHSSITIHPIPMKHQLSLALGVNVAFALLGMRAGALDRTGSVAGIVCGVSAWCAFGFSGFILIGLFATIGFAVTRSGYAQKAQRGVAQERGGRRTWVNVMANCAAPVASAVAVLVDSSLRMRCALGFVASIACALGDTVATELGQAIGGPCVLLPTLKRAPVGSAGGVSLWGTACGMVVLLMMNAVGLMLLRLQAERLAWLAAASVIAFFFESVIHQIQFVKRRGGWLPNLLATTLAASLAALGTD